jgi:hypothetical protein
MELLELPWSLAEPTIAVLAYVSYLLIEFSCYTELVNCNF